MGFRLSIDDFGTGYSSLSYIQQFPVDRLKIDSSFLAQGRRRGRTRGHPRRHRRPSRAHLNLEVVAEGVETFAQLEQVMASQCDFAQGFYFSRPAPAASCCQWPTSGVGD